VTMAGYENYLAVVYHNGPSLYGSQTLRVKIIDMTATGASSFQTIKDVECPISRYSNLTWFGFSEEGQLCNYDTEGIMRSLSFRNF
jgi:chromosome transmission fidelity protein 4